MLNNLEWSHYVTCRVGSISVEMPNRMVCSALLFLFFFCMQDREVIESNRGNNGEQKSASMANLLFEEASKVLSKQHGSRSYSYCRHYRLYFSNYQGVWQSAERMSTFGTKKWHESLFTHEARFFIDFQFRPLYVLRWFWLYFSDFVFLN